MADEDPQENQSGTITCYVDDQPIEIDQQELTVRRLLELAGARMDADGDEALLRELRGDQKIEHRDLDATIRVENDTRFYTADSAVDEEPEEETVSGLRTGNESVRGVNTGAVGGGAPIVGGGGRGPQGPGKRDDEPFRGKQPASTGNVGTQMGGRSTEIANAQPKTGATFGNETVPTAPSTPTTGRDTMYGSTESSNKGSMGGAQGGRATGGGRTESQKTGNISQTQTGAKSTGTPTPPQKGAANPPGFGKSDVATTGSNVPERQKQVQPTTGQNTQAFGQQKPRGQTGAQGQTSPQNVGGQQKSQNLPGAAVYNEGERREGGTRRSGTETRADQPVQKKEHKEEKNV